MTDGKTITAKTRIDLRHAHELQFWAKRFHITAEELQEAIRRVGTSSDAVQKHLSNPGAR